MCCRTGSFVRVIRCWTMRRNARLAISESCAARAQRDSEEPRWGGGGGGWGGWPTLGRRCRSGAAPCRLTARRVAAMRRGRRPTGRAVPGPPGPGGPRASSGRPPAHRASDDPSPRPRLPLGPGPGELEGLIRVGLGFRVGLGNWTRKPEVKCSGRCGNGPQAEMHGWAGLARAAAPAGSESGWPTMILPVAQFPARQPGGLSDSDRARAQRRS
jgi:hypothetical protein